VYSLNLKGYGSDDHDVLVWEDSWQYPECIMTSKTKIPVHHGKGRGE
jgi:hypothetical protein